MPVAEEEDYVPVGQPRKLGLGAPLRWLALGWADLRRAPGPSLACGALFALAGYVLLGLAWWGGNYLLLFVLATGFVLVAPALAFALYEVSRQLESGRQPRLGHALAVVRANFGNELVFAGVLMVILLLWARAAAMVHVFFPSTGTPGWSDLIGFFAIGSVVGAVFAALVFSVSVFSLPMMMDRRADVIVAAITSVRAVLTNKVVLLLWAGLIVAGVVLGFASGLLGLVVALPVIGHATWHGYRETILP